MPYPSTVDAGQLQTEPFVSLYNTTQTSVSSWGGSGALTVGQYNEVMINVNVTAFSGTSIAFKLQRQDVFGNYITNYAPSTVVGTGSFAFTIGAGMVQNQGIGNVVQLIATFTSVTATFTVDVQAR